MGLFDGAKAALAGRRAYQAHVSANKLADEGKPSAAKAKYDEALRLYGEAERLGLDAFNILMGYAVLLLREGENEKARELMLKLGKRKGLKDDEWFSLRLQFSIYQWKTGALDKAVETIGRAAAYKENGVIFGTLGMYLTDRAKLTGEYEEALAYARRGLEYDDEDAAVLDNIAQLYESMAEGAEGEQAARYRAQAVEYYEKAHAQKPRQITTLYALARLYHEDGRDDRARELLAVRDTLYVSALCPVSKAMLDDLAGRVG